MHSQDTDTSVHSGEGAEYRTANLAIRKVIVQEEKDLRQRHPWLRHQDAIGAAVLGVVVLTIATAVGTYLAGLIPAALAVVVIAIAMSFAHEMEHDLIHSLYFSSRPRLQTAAMYLIWAVKLHVNPLWRRKIHLRHHSYSGHAEDWEERLLGMGLPLGWRRLVTILHPFGSGLLMRGVRKGDRSFSRREAFNANVVGGYIFISLNILMVTGWLLPSALREFVPETIWQTVTALNLLWLLPAALRHTCLTIITTMSHYADDIPRNNVHFENQILDHWMLAPLHLFCFNFGATHIIHHYVAFQPFYIRQAIAKPVHAEMLKHGVRHNDLGIMVRANRWSRDQVRQAPAQARAG